MFHLQERSVSFKLAIVCHVFEKTFSFVHTGAKPRIRPIINGNKVGDIICGVSFSFNLVQVVNRLFYC